MNSKTTIRWWERAYLPPQACKGLSGAPAQGESWGLQTHQWYIKPKQPAHKSEAQACQDWAWPGKAEHADSTGLGPVPGKDMRAQACQDWA